MTEDVVPGQAEIVDTEGRRRTVHGILFVELKAYVDSQLGGDAWRRLLHELGLAQQTYLATQPYPDEDLVRLVGAIADKIGSPTTSILKDFGKFIVPDLLSVYAAYMRPAWGALDLLEHVESTMHRAVRAQNPGATPPMLRCDRVGGDEVVITYTSPRRLCALGEGLIAGVADHYQVSLEVSQQTCMLRGNSSCQISVKLAF